MKFRILSLILLLAVSAQGQRHECERPCVAGDTRTCQYVFHMQEYHTLSRACFECPDVMSDCSRPECVAADGVSRPVLTINRMLPGPNIQVCEGDRIVVDVHNGQLSDIETIHWHGQHMRGYQFYDGAPFATQCPIVGSFRYNFVAATPGTMFWHSHSGLHRAEAIYGGLVVRQEEDPQAETYDVDDFDHILIIQEWFHMTTLDKFIGNLHANKDGLPDTILINGKGRNTRAEAEGVEAYPMPLEVLEVTQHLKHRLRIVNAGGQSCPIIVSVDNHRMTVIAADDQNIVPVTVDSFVIYSGERFDVVIEAAQPVDNYWIRVNGMMDCQTRQSYQGAILRYKGAPEVEPSATLEYNPDYPPGIVLNPFNSIGGENELTMMDLSSLEPYTLEEEVVKKFYLAFDYEAVNNSFVYNKDYYPYNQVAKKWKWGSPQINGISFAYPNSPPMSQPEEPQPSVCVHGEDMTPFCDGDFCFCTYVFNVDLGDTVELVLIDEGTFGAANHPFHMHGYSYSVVSMGKVGESTTLEEIKLLDEMGLIDRKLDNAVLKDTVTIADGGYTIVRFTADNPGYWLMHCHLIFHSEAGMVAIIHVGTPDDLPPIPEGFPKCKAFLPPIE